MQKIMQDMRQFNEKFDLPAPQVPTVMSHDYFIFRVNGMVEEVCELMSAHQAGDLPKALDALIDIIYFTAGTIHAMGMNHLAPAAWDMVQRANMSKTRATSHNESKRGSQLDIIKPPGWEPPAIHTLFKETQDDEKEGNQTRHQGPNSSEYDGPMY